MIVATELANVLRQISHPDRIRILLKLQSGEQTVNELAAALEIPPTRVSQHLGVLRAIALVETENQGQKRVYSLPQPELAMWLIEGIDFIAHRLGRASEHDIAFAKQLWISEGSGAAAAPAAPAPLPPQKPASKSAGQAQPVALRAAVN
jgi:DNA-binding transcriptional ArsR family regulator